MTFCNSEQWIFNASFLRWACTQWPPPLNNLEILTEGREVSTGSGNWKALAFSLSNSIPKKAIWEFKVQTGRKILVSACWTKGSFYKGAVRLKNVAASLKSQLLLDFGRARGWRLHKSLPQILIPGVNGTIKRQFGMYRPYLTGLIHTSRHTEVNGFVCIGLGLAWEQRLHEEPSFCSPVQKGCVGSGNLTFLWQNSLKPSVHIQLLYMNVV